MNFFLKPYTILFSSTLMTGILITVSSNNWLSMWIGLELNLYSFIPLILQNQHNQEKEAAIKYFLIQALASIILLMATIPPQTFNWTMLLFMSMIMKLGMAPCHFWLPSVMNSLSWNLCWILATMQKIAPMIMLTQMFYNLTPMLTYFISIMSAMTGALGGMNQTQLRAILAYSSIGHMGWMTASSLASPMITMLYLMAYIIILTALIQPFSSTSILSPDNFLMKTAPTNTMKTSTIINLLSLGGIPPLFGFFPKMMVILSLTSMNFILLPLILISSSTLNLYYYLKIILNAYFSKNNMFTPYYPMKYKYMKIVMSSMFSSMIAMTIIILII